MNEERLSDVLSNRDSRWATPGRVAKLAELSTLYEENGVLPEGFVPALQRCCPSSSFCWARAQHRLQEEEPAAEGHGENASIFWPWIGDDYRAGGVCMVALNLNHADGGWWSINEEYAIAGHAIDRLAEGRKNVYRGSSFHYRAMATALAVGTSLEGGEPVERPRPEDAATAYQRVARVQAVKCVPRGHKSYPTRAMRSFCAPRFARREVELLEPGAIVALGGDARAALDLLGEIKWRHQEQRYAAGTLALTERSVDVIVLPHPNSHGRLWPIGQAELVAHLRAEPLGPGGR